MSDILIKNMEMPPNCKACPCSLIFRKRGSEEEDIHCFFQLEYGSTTMDRCPLVEVKAHGDLIDRDEAMAVFADRMCVDDILDGVYEPAVEVLRSAPTILEASDGTDNQG